MHTSFVHSCFDGGEHLCFHATISGFVHHGTGRDVAHLSRGSVDGFKLYQPWKSYGLASLEAGSEDINKAVNSGVGLDPCEPCIG